MGLEWDEEKRQEALRDHGLDFADCAEVFAGATFEFPDTRKDYGERRTACVDFLKGRMVAVVYTPRGKPRRVISMRKCNDREIQSYRDRIGA